MLIRMDDISENMNWNLMKKCELLFDKYNIKPLLGVIPNCKDPELKRYQYNKNFWSDVRRWHKKGWEISMHGHNHLYSQDTKKKDYFNYGGKSEFYGLSYNEQVSKLTKGKDKFLKEGIKVKSFFAPNHTYDLNTLMALKKSKIDVVIDGYGLVPFIKHGLTFIPQLFYKEIMLPFGFQSTQLHINYWKDKDYRLFVKFIEKNHKNIRPFNFFLENSNNTLIVNLINKAVEKSIKCIRFIFNKKKQSALSSVG